MLDDLVIKCYRLDERFLTDLKANLDVAIKMSLFLFARKCIVPGGLNVIANGCSQQCLADSRNH